MAHVTLRWLQARNLLVPERGHFCITCHKGFSPRSRQRQGFSAVSVTTVSSAVWALQQSGDLMVVRHRDGLNEIVF